ncbi:MAG: response regulator [Alphaproteobacteria bacterium]|nr:response regulator [Alphaproteobacteria bacterium]
MTVTASPLDIGLSKPMVALIDDDAAVRSAIQFLLEVHGFTVMTYASGAEFLAELPKITLLIVEQEPTGVSGLRVVRQFRRVVGPSVPVLMFSSVLGCDTDARPLDLGVTRVVQKPKVLELLQAVHSVLSGACVGLSNNGHMVGEVELIPAVPD